MKSAPSIDRLRELLDYDAATGLLRWRVSRYRVRAGDECSCLTGGYIKVVVDQVALRGHRIAWALHFGCWPSGDIDHINGLRADNRIANLRDIPAALNAQNLRAAKTHSTHGFLGVSRTKTGRWKAAITVDRRPIHLGYFDAPGLAHAAYVNAKRHYHQEVNTL